MSVCCGVERATAFCPECGKPLRNTAGKELLSHVETILRAAMQRHRGRSASLSKAKDDDSRKRHQSKLAIVDKRIDKLRAWVHFIATHPAMSDPSATGNR